MCDQCFDEGWMTKVQFIPDFIMTHENCGGRMIEAPKGSQTLACMKCGKVNYSRINDDQEEWLTHEPEHYPMGEEE